MPWLKGGDNAATHPIVMRAYQQPLPEGLRERLTDETFLRALLVNATFGFALRAALQSAGHTTDYVVDEGTLHMLGGAATTVLDDHATGAGYWKRRRGKRELVKDPDFLHIRLRSELDWEKQQRADAANPALTVPVRQRDGDACRYCGHIVSWGARKGARRGTYDHREPGQAARIETLVVACGGCNSGRRDRPDADQAYPLRPVPPTPFYGANSIAFLAAHSAEGLATQMDERPGSQPVPAPRDAAIQRPTATAPVMVPPAQRGPAPSGGSQLGSADPADPVPAESKSAGSGRVRPPGGGLGSGGRPPPRGRRGGRRHRLPPGAPL